MVVWGRWRRPAQLARPLAPRLPQERVNGLARLLRRHMLQHHPQLLLLVSAGPAACLLVGVDALQQLLQQGGVRISSNGREVCCQGGDVFI